jgi:hypothetical protein
MLQQNRYWLVALAYSCWVINCWKFVWIRSDLITVPRGVGDYPSAPAVPQYPFGFLQSSPACAARRFAGLGRAAASCQFEVCGALGKTPRQDHLLCCCECVSGLLKLWECSETLLLNGLLPELLLSFHC